MMYIVNIIIDVYFYRSFVLMFLLLWVVVVDNFYLIFVMILVKLMNIIFKVNINVYLINVLVFKKCFICLL